MHSIRRDTVEERLDEGLVPQIGEIYIHTINNQKQKEIITPQKIEGLRRLDLLALPAAASTC